MIKCDDHRACILHKQLPIYPPMKQKTLYFLVASLLITSLMLSCNKRELMPDPIITDYVLIQGDTIKTRIESTFGKIKDMNPMRIMRFVVGDTVMTYKKPQLHAKPNFKPNLLILKNNEDPELRGKPLRMVTIGGSLTAGVRDGGYFNEGIETSYPNLIARQMGIEFKQPYFPDIDYNGTGRKVLSTTNPTGGPVPKFKDVKNNLALKNIKDDSYDLPKATGIIDNYGFPFTGIAPIWHGNLELDLFDFQKDNTKTLLKFQASKPYLFRFKREAFDKDLRKQITANNYDLLLIELGFDDFINSFNEIGGTGISTGLGTDFIKDILNSYTKDKKTKVCLSNLPDFLNGPYINMITLNQIKNSTNNTPFYWDNGSISNVLNENSRFIPNSEIDSLSNSKVSLALKPGIKPNKELGSNSIYPNPFAKLINGKTQYDIKIEELAKESGYALADLRGLYQKIYTGKYFEDGIFIDPKWPNGNFFSSDGIFPSALGQAVIANEFIRALNATYKSDIPFIKVSEYASKK